MTRLVAVDPQQPDVEAIREAADVLRGGGLVAFPTETVYGLGAHALDARALAALFTAKGRPTSDPVIVHVAAAADVTGLAAHVPDVAKPLMHTFWPGPLTLVLTKQAHVPDLVTAGLPSVAVRVPRHPIAQRLLAAAGLPVAAPSANRFSRPSPTRAEHVLEDLDGRIDLIIDGGPTAIGVESTILDLTRVPPLVRRPGGVTLEEIRRLLPDAQLLSEVSSIDKPQPAPGQLLRHYAPRAAVTLYLGRTEAAAERVATDARTAVAAGQRVGILAPEEDLMALAPRLAAVAGRGRVITMRCGSRRARADSAADLFQVLRALDREGVDLILAINPNAPGLDAAMIDRLTRAAEGRVVVIE